MGKILGIDLAGYSVPEKVGLALIDQDHQLTWTNAKAAGCPDNETLIHYALEHRVSTIAVDAPLSLPTELVEMITKEKAFNDQDGNWRKLYGRDCERNSPIGLNALHGFMTAITIRGYHLGLRLQEIIQEKQLSSPPNIIEVYPRATLQVWECKQCWNKKTRTIDHVPSCMQQFVKDRYQTPLNIPEVLSGSEHECDAIIAAATGQAFEIETRGKSMDPQQLTEQWWKPQANL